VTVQPLGFVRELAFPDLLLDLVQRRDLLECLACGLRPGVPGLEDAAPRVDPTLRVLDAGLPGMGVAGHLTVGPQHRARREFCSQNLRHVLVATRFEVREALLVLVVIDRPEAGRQHSAIASLPGLDRDLVHRDDVVRADRGELGVEDEFEQLRALLHALRQPGPAERESPVEQALLLAIQRQVVEELVDQQPDDASSHRSGFPR